MELYKYTNLGITQNLVIDVVIKGPNENSETLLDEFKLKVQIKKKSSVFYVIQYLAG